VVKGEMTMNQGDGVKKEDIKVERHGRGRTRFSQETTYSETGYSEIEDGRESWDSEARLGKY
jgi:hypothetical protein